MAQHAAVMVPALIVLVHALALVLERVMVAMAHVADGVMVVIVHVQVLVLDAGIHVIILVLVPVPGAILHAQECA